MTALMILMLCTAIGLIVVISAAADGVWTFIKLAAWACAMWVVTLAFSAILIGVFHTIGLGISIAINLGLLWILYKFARAFRIKSDSKRHPEKYMILDKVCGECGRAIMLDPLWPDENQPYEHIYDMDEDHALVAVDGRPDLLDNFPGLERRRRA